MGRKRRNKKTKASRRGKDERGLGRHLPDRNPEFSFLITDTQTSVYKREPEREKEKR